MRKFSVLFILVTLLLLLSIPSFAADSNDFISTDNGWIYWLRSGSTWYGEWDLDGSTPSTYFYDRSGVWFRLNQRPPYPTSGVSFYGRFIAPSQPSSVSYCGISCRFTFLNGYVYFSGSGVIDTNVQDLVVLWDSPVTGLVSLDYCYSDVSSYQSLDVGIGNATHTVPYSGTASNENYNNAFVQSGLITNVPGDSALYKIPVWVYVNDNQKAGAFSIDIQISNGLAVGYNAYDSSGNVVPIGFHASSDYVMSQNAVVQGSEKVTSANIEVVKNWIVASDPQHPADDKGYIIMNGFWYRDDNGNLQFNDGISRTPVYTYRDTALSVEQDSAFLDKSTCSIQFMGSDVSSTGTWVEIDVYCIGRGVSQSTNYYIPTYTITSCGCYLNASDAALGELAPFASRLKSLFDIQNRVFVDSIGSLANRLDPQDVDTSSAENLSNQSQELSNSVSQMDNMAKPSPDDVELDLNIDTQSMSSYMMVINPLFSSSTLLKVFILGFTLLLVSYVFFGKKS